MSKASARVLAAWERARAIPQLDADARVVYADYVRTGRVPDRLPGTNLDRHRIRAALDALRRHELITTAPKDTSTHARRAA